MPLLTEVQPEKKRRKWQLWLLGATVVISVVVVALTKLDTWLHQTLEQQVTQASEGYYSLRIRELHTSLWNRSLTARGVQLRSSSRANEHLPPVRADVNLVRVQGIGLLSLLRKGVVPLNKLMVENIRLEVGKMPPSATRPSKALYERLPLQVKGIRLNHLFLVNVGGNYRPDQQPVFSLGRGDLEAHDILISAAGAADSQRLGYARRASFHLTYAHVVAKEYVGRVKALQFSTERQLLALDSVRVLAVKQNKERANNAARLTLSLPQVRLTGIQAYSLARKMVQADSLLLTSPDATLLASSPTTKTKTLPLHEQLAPWLNRCVLRHVSLSGGQFRLPNIAGAPVVQAVRLQATDVRIDSLGASDPARIFYARAWKVRTGPATAVVDAPFYRAHYEKLHLDTRTGIAQADGLTLIPTMGPAEFARRKRLSASRLTARLTKLRLVGLDCAALARNGILVAKALELHNPRLQLTGDENYPPSTDLSVVSPEQLRRLPIRVNLGTAKIINLSFQSSEIAKGSKIPVDFTITRLNANISPFTNIPDSRIAGLSIGRVSGWLEGKCFMQGVFKFNFTDPQGRHSLVGSFGPTPFAILNPVSEPSARIRFERGQVEYIQCNFQFDRRGARGTVWTRYSDLKVSFIKRSRGPDKKNIFTRAESFLTNRLVVRGNNPRRPGQALEPGKVEIGRDLTHSVFWVWRMAMIEGLLSSVGVPDAFTDTME
ncbi:hypothetical protein H8B13_10470 [Hymenobacter sp. BT188]|uniref:hypothetical protein n=1 Tax=Hymenobacter sp. BT188 TaxID=2763504 RepID=UPI001650E214|nr:hypothetical protein [Hymenobacter sp. BT188]MBC6607242.1 hypothetical protein [Hymenobacter sp. BT188]